MIQCLKTNPRETLTCFDNFHWNIETNTNTHINVVHTLSNGGLYSPTPIVYVYVCLFALNKLFCNTIRVCIHRGPLTFTPAAKALTSTSHARIHTNHPIFINVCVQRLTNDTVVTYDV